MLRINAAISALASLVTLLLMIFMWRNGTLKVNLFLKCVMIMAISQLLYDAAIPFILLADRMEYAGIIFGRMGALIWSLMILVTAIYIVQMQKSLTIRQQLEGFVVIATLITTYTMACKMCHDKNISLRYSEILRALIAFDLSAFTWMFYIYRMKGVGKDKMQTPLYQELRILIFYPIMQVVDLCRQWACGGRSERFSRLFRNIRKSLLMAHSLTS